MEPEQFGQYRLEQLIGRGGMGEVYRAFDTVRGRVVALKRLPAQLATNAEFQARFRKESALAARLSEPHIIPIHDFGEIDGRLYIDMRLVDGRDLGSVLKAQGPLTPEQAVAVVAQVAGALDAAHADGLVHRDVKPSNVLLTGPAGQEFVYLVDFGIARSVGSTDETSLTVTGATVGTLDYMAPERFAGGGSDHRADIYSLACLLFEALTGRKPFRGEGVPAMIHAHLNVEPPQPSRERPAVPVALDAVIARGMAKNPGDRYPTARALADAALVALRAGPPGVDPATMIVGGAPPPWPAARTMVGLPNAGFSLPGAPVAAPPRRGPIVAAVLAAVVVVAGIVTAVVLLGSRGPVGPVAPTSAVAAPPTTTAAAPTTTARPTVPPTSAAAVDYPQPASLPGADAAADKDLWDALKGSGVEWKGCEYTKSAVGTTLSYVLCNTTDPVLEERLGFESYASAEEVQGEIDGYTGRLTGDAGSCQSGHRFSGTVSGRQVACGTFTFDDGTNAYFIVWTRPGLTVFAAAADPDPAKVWEWFLAHDPI